MQVTLESLAWALYLDTGSSRIFEQWLVLWKEAKLPIPEGAWT